MTNYMRQVFKISRGLSVHAAVIVLLFYGQSVSAVTLDVNVLSPSPTITVLDPIHLSAVTSQEVLPDTTWRTHTTSLVVDGFDIEWELASYQVPGVGLQIIIPAGDVQTLAPLPAGTYTVTATWVGEAPIWYSGPLPLVGSTQFTVVPEPATLLLLAGGMLFICNRSRGY